MGTLLETIGIVLVTHFRFGLPNGSPIGDNLTTIGFFASIVFPSVLAWALFKSLSFLAALSSGQYLRSILNKFVAEKEGSGRRQVITRTNELIKVPYSLKFYFWQTDDKNQRTIIYPYFKSMYFQYYTKHIAK